MEQDKRLTALKQLIQLDVDAIGAYEAAIARVEVAEVRDQLAGFRVDHTRHVQDLSALITAMGGESIEPVPDFKGAVLKGFTAVTSMMGTEAALLAMLGNEELTTRSYDAALKVDWTPEQRTVIEKNRADEHRHLDWIKQAAKSRSWARVSAT